MDNSMLTGKYLWKIVTEDEEVKKLIPPAKVCPLMALADTTFPFVVYSRDALVPEYTKDMLSSNNLTFTFITVTNKYEDGVVIANAIRNALECKYYKDEDIYIHPIKVTALYEETVDDAFLQRMTFNMDVTQN